jgi:hypothetical protein
MHSATVSSNVRSCSNSEQNGASRRTSKWATTGSDAGRLVPTHFNRRMTVPSETVDAPMPILLAFSSAVSGSDLGIAHETP